MILPILIAPSHLIFILATLLFLGRTAAAETIYIDADASPRIAFGADRVAQALQAIGHTATLTHDPATAGPNPIVIFANNSSKPSHFSQLPFAPPNETRPEGFNLLSGNGITAIIGHDENGTLYGCLELATRIQQSHQIPANLQFNDAPSMIVRGTCIGMQKTYLLPGRKTYEYPYTPDLFPFFYDKAFWQKYLDFLADHRMNALYLWSGHPFASLVRVPAYPYAVEVPDDILARNQAMYHYILDEADKRGIMVMQMFYNILVSKPFAEKNNLPSTQFAAPTPLLADYTQKSIAAFVKEYPKSGLMVCLGEALKGETSDPDRQLNWMTQVIIPGIHEGMAQAGLKQDIPLMLRTHAMPAEQVVPAVIKLYPKLYTESKYNGESLTTWQPRGQWMEEHQAMTKAGAIHSINVHILANLEPFRYGAQRFIKLCMQAAEDRDDAKGVHLYPLSYWNWPDAPDKTATPLQQIDRDWIWFEAWSRYAWNPRIDEAEDHRYWVSRLADVYGTPEAAENILAAYNDSGECAPRILRRFGITEGNRQTMSLGMTLDELVNPQKYNEFSGLWEWQSPPGERLKEYVAKEFAKQPHEGETPPQINQEVLDFSKKAVDEIEAAVPLVTKNKEEFDRLRNDMHCIRAMSENYTAKTKAAMGVLRYDLSHDPADMVQAEKDLADSLGYYRELTALTKDTYNYANSMQTNQRKIPVSGGTGGKPANYLWSQLLPVYEKELADFHNRVQQINAGKPAAQTASPLQRLPKVGILPTTAGTELYTVQVGAKVFTDSDAVIQSLAPELVGLNGIRVAKAGGKLECDSRAPVLVLIGYFKGQGNQWLQPPQLDKDAAAAETMGDAVIQNAAKISGMPDLDVRAIRFDKGKHALDLRGSGTYVVLGVIPAAVKMQGRDAQGGTPDNAAGGAAK